jgi:HK97 gp10 family phage protein
MVGFTAQIVGLKELDQKLTELKTTQAQHIIREGLKAGGAVFQTAIAERAPERPDLPSGTALPVGALQRDIEVKFGRDDQGLPAVIVAPGKYTAHAARWVEYGHRLVRGGYSRLITSGRHAGKTRGPGKQVGEVEQHPFIRPGYEAAREEAVKVTIATIAAGVEKAAKS